MGLNKEDRILIKNLYLLKGYGAKRLIKQFPTKCWKKNYTERFLEAIRNHRFRGAQGRLRTVRTTENIDAVNELVLSQEDAPQSHHTTRQIVRETDKRQVHWQHQCFQLYAPFSADRCRCHGNHAGGSRPI